MTDGTEQLNHAVTGPRNDLLALQNWRGLLASPFLVLLIGAAMLAIPTLVFVAQSSWSREEGGHGPIVLFSGLWLAHRVWPEARAYIAPPHWTRPTAMLAVLLPAFLLTRVTQIVEIEGYLMYACLLTAAYAIIGGRAMALMWFPLFYLSFIFPPPDSLVDALTGPLKILLSKMAISVLSLFGYPIAGQGVAIYVGQYELLVAAACSGLNSIVSLSAISLFYIYMRHKANWRYAALLSLLIVPVAMIANFVRVLILILLTYHSGEAAAQGFLHNFAGLVMFAAALLTIFGLDALLHPLEGRMAAGEVDKAFDKVDMQRVNEDEHV